MIGKGKVSKFFEFGWWISEDGFQWVDNPNGDGLSLQPLVASRFHTKGHSYLPLQEYSGLFRILAETSPTPDACLEFANRFGGLFGKGGRPEQFHDWQIQVLKLREVVLLWDLVRKYNKEALAKHILRKGPPKVILKKEELDHPTYYFNAYPDGQSPGRMLDGSGPILIPDDWVERIDPDDLRTPAMLRISSIVNSRLTELNVSPQLCPGGRGESLRLYLLPQNLLGAIWLQFASAIDADHEYRRCGGCDTWFALTPETARADSHYCSDACRSRAYRQRKQRSWELRAKGLTPSAIAKELDSDVNTVKKWINQKKG
jgi:hypothetical protein